jgi:hypothetical protein
MAKRSLIVAAAFLMSSATALAQATAPPGQDSRAPSQQGYGTPESPRNAEKSERPATAARPEANQHDLATTGQAPESSDKMHPEAQKDSAGTKMPPGGEIK